MLGEDECLFAPRPAHDLHHRPRVLKVEAGRHHGYLIVKLGTELFGALSETGGVERRRCSLIP